MHSNRTRWTVATVFVLAAAALALAQAPAGETKLLRLPDISDNAVVFVYAGNLWTVGLDGGTARKLTSHPGLEYFPKFSPDGKQIAFTAQYDGNTDVYEIPADGGQPVRLTWHPMSDRVVDWYPGGDKILFLSRRASWKERFERYFSVPAAGGQPEGLVLPEGGAACFSPDGRRLAYTPINIETRTWKRYRGGMAPDIWIYDFAKNQAEKITDDPASDQFPMWHGDKIYFVSDREHTMNVYCYDLKSKQTAKITNHADFDVKWPSIGGDRIVYENGGSLWVLNLKNNQTQKLVVRVPDDEIQARPHIVQADKYIQQGTLSPTAKRAVFEARGDLFTVPAEKGNARNLTNSPAWRERDPVWSPDGKWIAYLSDRSGEYEICLRRSDGEGDETRVTTDGGCFRYPLRWSPDSKKLLYADSRFRYFYVDIDEKKPVQFDQDPWSHTPNEYGWSGDSNWILYTKNNAGRTSSAYLYSLKDKSVRRVTPAEVNVLSPVFDREGKYLFYAAQRNFAPAFDEYDSGFIYEKSVRLFAVPLQKDGVSPLAPESDEEVIKEEKKEEAKAPDAGEKPADAAAKPAAEAAGADQAKKDEAKKEEKKEWVVDLDGIETRAVCLPVPAGRYGALQAGEGMLFFMGYEPGGGGEDDGPGGGELKAYDLKKRETQSVIAGIMGYELSADGKKIGYAAPGNVWGIIDAKPGPNKPGSGKINTADMRIKVDPAAEWKQIFNEAWRNERDFFYDPKLHGVDWNLMKERYGSLVPYCAHREDLNYLLGELIAELNCSHTYVGGGDLPEVPRVGVGLLGADISPDKASKKYRIDKILMGEDWDQRRISPLAQPGLKVKAGQYVLAVNGREVNWPENFYSFFEDTVGKQVQLTVNDKPAMEGSWEIVVKPVGDEQQLRYLDQVEANRRKVEQATGGKVGYIHVPSTGVDGLNEFYRGYLSQFNHEGLIVDVRYNNGGMVPDRFIEVLRRPLMSYWATQRSESMTTPGRPTPPYLACIINSYAGSGGDAFPYYFKFFQLGPLVGTRTWGGLVGISRNLPFVDGGGVTVPDFGTYSVDGKWTVENHGVDPDVPVENAPDQVVAGRDPQLEKAIELVMAQIKAKPPVTPPKPVYPVRN